MGGLAMKLVRLGEPHSPDRKTREATVAFRLIFLVAVIGLYAYGHQQPVGHPSLWCGVTDPLALLKFVAAYLAAPVSSPFGNWNVAIGLLGLVLFAACACWWFRYVRSNERANEACAPWLGLALFAVCSAVLTGLSRACFGWEQALQSRYAPISALFGTAVLALCNWVTVSRQFITGANKAEIKERHIRNILAEVVCGIMVLCVWSAVIRTQQEVRTMGKATLVRETLAFGENVLDLMPDSDLPYPNRSRLTDALVPTVRRLSLSVFRESR